MGSTSAGLRYVELSDSPNAQTLVKNLADDLNARHVPIFATTGARDTAFPSPTNGQVCYISANDQLMIRSGGTWIELAPRVTSTFKTADTTRNNTNTLAADPHLVTALQANATYQLELNAVYTSSVTPGFKLDFTMPAGATINVFNFVTGGTGSAVQVGSSPNGVINGITGTGAIAPLMIQATITTTATPGNITFRWAQNVANATNTTVSLGSTLVLTRVT